MQFNHWDITYAITFGSCNNNSTRSMSGHITTPIEARNMHSTWNYIVARAFERLVANSRRIKPVSVVRTIIFTCNLEIRHYLSDERRCHHPSNLNLLSLCNTVLLRREFSIRSLCVFILCTLYTLEVLGFPNK